MSEHFLTNCRPALFVLLVLMVGEVNPSVSFHISRDTIYEEWVKQMSPGTVVFHAGIRTDELDVVKILQFAIKSVREVHVVHHDNTHYQLRRGIPQGSRLSIALCHIYYGHLVRENLSEFLNQPDDLLIRVVDDFLYLTPNSERARVFHHRIHQGFTDYSAYVNIKKSATNSQSAADLIKPRDETNDKALRKPVCVSFRGCNSIRKLWKFVETTPSTKERTLSIASRRQLESPANYYSSVYKAFLL